jgi:pimeloyl-ACP methyl ester carboxylesterase
METTFLDVHGLRIRTILAGDPGAPPLVLLHGYPTSSALWRNCIPVLARHRRVLAPDLPGHGESDKPLGVDYDLPFFIRFLEGFADAAGLARFALAAHDLGGMVALGFAARRPARLTRLVVMDTAPYARWPLACRLLVGTARHPAMASLLLRRPVFRMLMRAGVHRGGAMGGELADRYRSHWVASPEARRAFSGTVSMPPARWALPLEELRAISAPTLVLWAARDLLFGAGVARRLCRDIQGARLLVLPRCGHFLQEDDPAAVAEAIDRFVSPGDAP